MSFQIMPELDHDLNKCFKTFDVFSFFLNTAYVSNARCLPPCVGAKARAQDSCSNGHIPCIAHIARIVDIFCTVCIAYIVSIPSIPCIDCFVWLGSPPSALRLSAVSAGRKADRGDENPRRSPRSSFAPPRLLRRRLEPSPPWRKNEKHTRLRRVTRSMAP